VDSIDKETEKPEEKKKKERAGLIKTIQKMTDEQVKQTKNVAAVYARLKKEKDSWLEGATDRNLTVTKFLQYCVLPRCFSSGIDALYCAKFIYTVHSLETPWFSIIHFYDQITKILIAIISSCSANEATRFGRFLKELLEPLHTWKKNKEQYDKECMSRPSFAIDFYKPHGARLSYDKFLIIVQRWHKVITKVFSSTLASKCKMRMGNALLILTRVGVVYPRVATHGEHLLERLASVMNDAEHKQSSLKILATRTHALLCSEKKNWISEKAFTPTKSLKPSAPPSYCCPSL